MSNAKIGTFDDLLELAQGAVQPIARALRETVLKVDSSACEVVRLGDRAATYGVGPRKMIDGYVYILPYKNWVNLGFYQGAEIDDPEELLEGTGAKLRHVKIHSVEEAKRPSMVALVERALEHRKATNAAK
ncbi:MAG: DUF1801 domain-containing protein [bacterium]|nr:DUF1801 domain-containing protein [bacterium]MYB10626.1 DUF1801 domain-containing protein [Acidimicrobiia bacterium]MYG58105.1 DUF1801 domain-containing protein [Acidimicrobiia bacterium]MYJ32990.1 DUF1801 domain-containing protein [Acidimicrobiia bacterium]